MDGLIKLSIKFQTVLDEIVYKFIDGFIQKCV
jgi:hypothetical protein